MSDHELARMREEYARQTAEWNRLRERLAQLPAGTRIAMAALDDADDRRRDPGLASALLSPGLRG